MTRSNRVVNRIILFVVGLTALAGGAVLLLPLLGRAAPLRLPAPDTLAPATLAIVSVATAIVVVLSVAWIVTRGRGRTSQLLVVPGEAGVLTLDSRVAADLVADALAHNADVVSVGSAGFRMRGRTVLSLRVVARRAADLSSLVAAVSEAIGALDAILDTRLPVLLQVVPGVRVIRARENRAR
ncbi:hypothetical protein [Galbitalea soli]|uniref:Alkaline shock response membrane anchor protein AmaP n=1 Tax=Galbitalea soli TaxID=1268042 RepID=A0A7C9TSI2_9MICO|nr:hypothetical protein [Galbitalea soli]NEM91623.1 hypothetical protein [Galbitalea soli]NYJ30317.1 hypothetical protein [Galbitalea soli]